MTLRRIFIINNLFLLPYMTKTHVIKLLNQFNFNHYRDNLVQMDSSPQVVEDKEADTFAAESDE